MLRLQGKNLIVPGDKSITHRAYFFGAFSRGESRVLNASPALDCFSTRKCLEALSLEFERTGQDVLIKSGGIDSLRAPKSTLNAGNSGTTIRLLAGLLSGRPFSAELDGDESLRRRPLKRVTDLLKTMGADFEESEGGGAPVKVHGNSLEGGSFQLEQASAQVQTALVLAGLQALGETSIVVPHIVRDHTYRILKHLDIPMTSNSPRHLSVFGLRGPIEPFEITIPGDISSASYFMVAAALLPGSSVSFDNLGVNEGRTLIMKVLQKMGAKIRLENERLLCEEPVATVEIRFKDRLNGAEISKKDLASGIDELPILALAGAFCRGEFKVQGAVELRHKESDRFALLVENLQNAGASIQASGDDFSIKGKEKINGGSLWKTGGDHRLAMTGLIANLLFEKPVEVDDTSCIDVSYPGFQADLAMFLK